MNVRHGKYIYKSEGNYLAVSFNHLSIRFTHRGRVGAGMLHISSGVYICKSIVNYLRHGNFIYKSEVIHRSSESKAWN